MGDEIRAGGDGGRRGNGTRRARVRRLLGQSGDLHIDWTGAGDGTTWTDPANWNGSLPGPTDHACIQPGSAVTVTHTIASTSIASLETNAFASVDVATGTLSVTSPTDASPFGADLILSGSGDVSFAGPVSIAGDLANSGLSAALLTLDGTTTVSGNLLFEDNASNEIGGAGTLAIAGDLDWEQGEFVAIPVTVAGTTTMHSISPKDIQDGAVVTLARSCWPVVTQCASNVSASAWALACADSRWCADNPA